MWLNRRWVEADLRLCTGFIEPHFFAGYSGGSKAVVPGLAGLSTALHFHRAFLIAHPRITWGDLSQNPLQALTREMTGLCPPDFLVNVTLNREKAITAAFAGRVRDAYEAGCAAPAASPFRYASSSFGDLCSSNRRWGRKGPFRFGSILCDFMPGFP